MADWLTLLIDEPINRKIISYNVDNQCVVSVV